MDFNLWKKAKKKQEQQSEKMKTIARIGEKKKGNRKS